MLKLSSFPVVVALSIAMPLAVAVTTAGAKEHVTYEEAWARCKKFVDVLPKDHQSARYSRGASCMHKYGYKL